MPILGGFQSVIMSEVPILFPELRFHWAEAAATWVPFVVKDLRRRWAAMGKELPENPMKEYRQYVTCQNDDELAMTYPLGPDNLVIGSDYGHYDGSSQMDATMIMRRRADVDEDAKRKILHDNPKRLWGL